MSKDNSININILYKYQNSVIAKMCSETWLVVGISGVTCGGKTTLAKRFESLALTKLVIISQDTYFRHPDSPHHVKVPELNHINWEILESLDMKKMENDIKQIINIDETICNNIKLVNLIKSTSKDTNNVNIVNLLKEKSISLLIIEGFSIFNYTPIKRLCHLLYYITLPRNVCKDRRDKRVYDPPDVPGYFDTIVWVEYERQRDEVFSTTQNVEILDGLENLDTHFNHILKDIVIIVNNKLCF